MTIAIVSNDKNSYAATFVESLQLASTIHITSPEKMRSHPQISNIDILVLETDNVTDIENTQTQLVALRLREHIPFLVLAPGTADMIQAAYAFSATDFIHKGCITEEFAMRLRNALVLAARWESDRQVIKGLGVQLQQTHQMSHSMADRAYLDSMTGLMGRKPFDEILQSYWLSCQRDATPISLIKVNIDHFRAFNETYGRSSGDRVIRSLANSIKESISRPSDTISRFSGSEIVVALPNTPPKGAESVAEKIKGAVKELQISHSYSRFVSHLTVSQGLATLIPNQDLEAKQLIRIANHGLEIAKKTPGGIYWDAPNFKEA